LEGLVLSLLGQEEDNINLAESQPDYTQRLCPKKTSHYI
jgi:hypothetical protein